MADAGIATYTNGIASSIFTIGYRCQVRVGTSATDAQVIGFVDSAEIVSKFKHKELRYWIQFSLLLLMLRLSS